MARASIPTLLALDRYKDIILQSVAPPHFNQGKGATIFPDTNDCSDIYFQYAWQDVDHVSREDINQAIKGAEDEITAVLGYSLAPTWIEEIHQFPRHHRPEVIQFGGLDVRGYRKSIKAKLGRFILAGQRATASVSAGRTVTYTDADGDGYKETATISATTAITNKCEIKVYFAGEGGNQEWEVRPARTVTLSGGTVTFTFWAWQLLNPDLWEAFPTTSGVPFIDLEVDANYVTAVDIFREFTDFTETSAQFFWEPQPLLQAGSLRIGLCPTCTTGTCPGCLLTTQAGCIHVRDVDNGFVVPTPATYNSTTEQWDQASFALCRDPDQIKVFYYSGEQSQRFLAGLDCDPLSLYWAEAIAWLATARIRKPFCGCERAHSLAEDLKRDLSFTGSRVQGSFTVSPDDLSNPFGTRLGEVQAWHRVSRLQSSIVGAVA